MSAKARIEAALARAVEAGAAPGIVTAAVTPQGETVHTAVGARGIEDATPVGEDSVFWIASCTKAITAAAALQLVETGALDLDEAVGSRIPELADPQVLTGFDAKGKPSFRPARSPITLRHLLSHTSGLAYDFFSADLSRCLAASGTALMGQEAPKVPLVFDPGEGWQYGIGLEWTAKLIEQASGQPFEDYLAARIFGPLGMADTAFWPTEAMAARAAAMHARTPDGGLTPMAFALPPGARFPMGGGGLNSTAADYLKFLKAMLAGGAPILGPASMRLMTTNQVGELAAGGLKTAQAQLSNDFDPFGGPTGRWSLGFLINTEPGAAGRAAGSLAWGGLANCYYWADPAKGAAGVFFSQVLPFADPAILAAFADFERAVYGA